MNGLIQRHRTLGELLAELKARLGFVAQGPASNNNNPLMISFLQEAHEYVYDQLNPTPMRKKTVISLEQGSYLYDWHNDTEDENIDPGLVRSVWLIDGKMRIPLSQGISEKDREDEGRAMPEKYDTLNGQIELWPVPDKSGYGLLVEYRLPSPVRAVVRPSGCIGQAGAAVCAGECQGAFPSSGFPVGGGAFQCADAARAGQAA